MPSTSQPNRASSSQLLYSSLSSVPLIKSPALRIPPPVSYPTSLHPLPASIKEYFVYPFQLEGFVMADRERREQRRREEMKRLAPGYDDSGPGSVLVPTTRSTGAPTAASSSSQVSGAAASLGGVGGVVGAGNDMDELLNQFEAFSTAPKPSQDANLDFRNQS